MKFISLIPCYAHVCTRAFCQFQHISYTFCTQENSSQFATRNNFAKKILWQRIAEDLWAILLYKMVIFYMQPLLLLLLLLRYISQPYLFCWLHTHELYEPNLSRSPIRIEIVCLFFLEWIFFVPNDVIYPTFSSKKPKKNRHK